MKTDTRANDEFSVSPPAFRGEMSIPRVPRAPSQDSRRRPKELSHTWADRLWKNLTGNCNSWGECFVHFGFLFLYTFLFSHDYFVGITMVPIFLMPIFVPFLNLNYVFG